MAAPPAPHSIARAALWMSGWLALMLLIAVAGRAAMHELDLFQIMFLRSLIGLALIAPWVWARGVQATWRTARPWAHGLRNAVHYAAQYGWFAALALIPLAQVVAIEFTMPLWSALLAALWLGESLGRRKIAAVALGLAGVLVIVRPAAQGLNPGQLIALAAAAGFAASVITVKSLTRTDSALTILLWMLLVQAALGALPALAVWRWPSGAAVWGWVAVVAFCGTFSHYCFARALQHAEATVVVPMDFLRVPASAALGAWLYHERVDGWTLVGVALILAGNLVNLRAAPAQPVPRGTTMAARSPENTP
jgi:drug/metabolite transporter (DMT)-like permease